MKARIWISFIAVSGVTNLVHADTIFWDATNSTLVEVTPATTPPTYIATGSWNDLANWSTGSSVTTNPSAIPDSDDIVTFNVSSTSTTIGPTISQVINLDGAQSAQGISVVSSNVISLAGGGTNRTLALGADGITISGASTLNIGSATAGQAVSVNLTASQSWLFNSTNTVGMLVRNPVAWTGSGTGTLTLGGSSGNSSAASTISGVISDGGTGSPLNITVNSSSISTRWVLSGANTYNGVTTISRGAVTLGNTRALGATTGNTVVTADGGLFIRSTIGTFNEALSLTGAGVDAKGTLRNVGGTNTWSGAITANTGAAGATSVVNIGSGNGAIFTISGAITTGAGGSLQFVTDLGDNSQTSTTTVTSDISGGAGVRKIASNTNGTGILVLSGTAKSYTGATSVDQGFLTLNTTLTNTSGVTVGTGAAGTSATLRGDGGSIRTAAETTINSTGTLAPGATSASIGALSMGTLNLMTGSTLAMDFNSATSAADSITITGNLVVDATNAALLSVNDLGSASLSVGTIIDLVRYSGDWNGGFFRVNGTVIGDESTTFTAGVNTFQLDYDRTSGADNFLSLVVVIPEPSAVLLMAGAAATFGLRRRRNA